MKLFFFSCSLFHLQLFLCLFFSQHTSAHVNVCKCLGLCFHYICIVLNQSKYIEYILFQKYMVFTTEYLNTFGKKVLRRYRLGKKCIIQSKRKPFEILKLCYWLCLFVYFFLFHFIVTVFAHCVRMKRSEKKTIELLHVCSIFDGYMCHNKERERKSNNDMYMRKRTNKQRERKNTASFQLKCSNSKKKRTKKKCSIIILNHWNWNSLHFIWLSKKVSISAFIPIEMILIMKCLRLENIPKRKKNELIPDNNTLNWFDCSGIR